MENYKSILEKPNQIETKAMFKVFSNETEWDIFRNVIQMNGYPCAKSKKEKELLKKIKASLWHDNTKTRPDFISEDIMIEMFEVDDIVTTKKGKNNPQRKADARALRTLQDFMAELPEESFHENVKLIAMGDTRYNPESNEFVQDKTEKHHNYQAYINNFKRICKKHLDSVKAYRTNYPNKQLGFLILDDSTLYMSREKLDKNFIRTTVTNAFFNFPLFDKNFMCEFITSDVDFILWAFNNKHLYMKQEHGQNSYLPDLFLISKDNYYTKQSKKFDATMMQSLER